MNHVNGAQKEMEAMKSQAGVALQAEDALQDYIQRNLAPRPVSGRELKHNVVTTSRILITGCPRLGFLLLIPHPSCTLFCVSVANVTQERTPCPPPSLPPPHPGSIATPPPPPPSFTHTYMRFFPALAGSV